MCVCVAVTIKYEAFPKLGYKWQNYARLSSKNI